MSVMLETLMFVMMVLIWHTPRNSGGTMMSVMMVLCLAHTWNVWRQVRNTDVCDDDTVSGTHLETLETGGTLSL